MQTPQMAELMQYSTVPITTFDKHGKSLSRATGALFAFTRTPGENPYPFIVTNRHVLEGADKIEVVFTEGKDGKPLLGSPIRIRFIDIQQTATFHPNRLIDVAVLPICTAITKVREDGKDFYQASIPNESIPDQNRLNEFSPIEDIVFVGYPVGIWDRRNLLPVFRRGITASPISVDFEGEPVFLIDASVFPGSSGSPVFFYQHGFHTNREGNTELVLNRALFLGIVAACYANNLSVSESVLEAAVETSRIEVTQPANLGIVYKAVTVVDTILNALKKS